MSIEKKNVEWTVANSTMAMIKTIVSTGRRDRFVCSYTNNLWIYFDLFHFPCQIYEVDIFYNSHFKIFPILFY